MNVSNKFESKLQFFQSATFFDWVNLNRMARHKIKARMWKFKLGLACLTIDYAPVPTGEANLKVGFLYLPIYQERFSGQCDEMLRPIDLWRIEWYDSIWIGSRYLLLFCM